MVLIMYGFSINCIPSNVILSTTLLEQKSLGYILLAPQRDAAAGPGVHGERSGCILCGGFLNLPAEQILVNQEIFSSKEIINDN
jgi:hypothetical protein